MPSALMWVTMKQDRKTIQNMLERYFIDLALVILLPLLCIPFVLCPPLNETPVRIILGLLLVLFLLGYSLIAALFLGNDDLYVIGLIIAVVPLLGLALNYTPFGIRLVPILVVLSVFTVSLVVIVYVGGGGFWKGSGVWFGLGGLYENRDTNESD